jgi:hypothetical protein
MTTATKKSGKSMTASQRQARWRAKRAARRAAEPVDPMLSRFKTAKELLGSAFDNLPIISTEELRLLGIDEERDTVDD